MQRYLTSYDILIQKMVIAIASKTRRGLNENQIIKYASNKNLSQDRVFISYSSFDKEWLSCICDIFRSFDAKPYLDSNDSFLPNRPSAQTATILKRRIQEIPKFVVLITSNVKESKWVPWELGLADGASGNSNVAIMPVEEKAIPISTSIAEYYQLYSQIFYDDTKQNYYVFDPANNNVLPLKLWLFR